MIVKLQASKNRDRDSCKLNHTTVVKVTIQNYRVIYTTSSAQRMTATRIHVRLPTAEIDHDSAQQQHAANDPAALALQYVQHFRRCVLARCIDSRNGNNDNDTEHQHRGGRLRGRCWC